MPFFKWQNLKILDNDSLTVMISSDLQETFATIDHDILLRKLSAIGFFWWHCEIIYQTEDFL